MFKPKYQLTDNIVRMLTTIAEARVVIERAKILPKNEIRLRRQALIRMTHSSTAIEGNQLSLGEVEDVLVNKKIDAPDRDIFEVQNYLKALKYIDFVVKEKQAITEKVLLKIHRLVTEKTLDKESSGHYRKGPVYIVKRQLGLPNEVMYTGPDAKKVPGLSKNLLKWIENSETEDINPIVVAGIVHQEIAAIHPFNDGNGRTARAMATLVLYKQGYDFRHLFALEDYYNENRSEYYKAINIGKNYEERKIDFTKWLEYFVQGFKEEIIDVRKKVIELPVVNLNKNIESQILIDEDQMKILDFLDQIGRIAVKDVIDILECPKRTAQLDLQKLKKIGVIKQVGKGPASAYVLSRRSKF